MIFLTSSVKLFTKCESFPRFTTNVFGTFVEDDLTFFFAPFVFSSLTACVRFFFLRVFAIITINTTTLSLAFSRQNREETPRRRPRPRRQIQRAFVVKMKVAAFFFEVSFFFESQNETVRKGKKIDESATEK